MTNTRPSTHDVRRREPYFDGIRAVAIATVMAFHWLTSYTPLFHGGYVGVDLFFVLSGFIITRILWQRASRVSLPREYGAFLRNRLRRLYPALLALVVVTLILVAVFGEPEPLGAAIAEVPITLGQATTFVLGLQQVHFSGVFSHSWSLSVEWVFYLVWPVIVIALRRRGVTPRRVASGAAVAAVVLYLASLPTSSNWFYYGPSSRAAQLLAGCALALWSLSERSKTLRRGWVITGLAIVSLVSIAGWTIFGPFPDGNSWKYLGFPLITVAGVILCSVPVLAPASRVRRLLSHRALAFLGRVSYSLYLFHLLGTEVLNKQRLPLPIPALALAAVIMTITSTALSYRFLELPFMSSKKKVLDAGPELIGQTNGS